MKFIHLADLHLGRRVCGFSLIDDQKDILEKITGMIKAEKPDFVIIAGDVYDKLSPPVEAVTLLDEFLTDLSDSGIETFIIAGNHDSPERIAFGASLMNRSGIHFSPIYNGKAERFTVADEFGSLQGGDKISDCQLMPLIETTVILDHDLFLGSICIQRIIRY